MSLAPVVLFVYKRPEHAARTLAALGANPEAPDSDLIVYADGSKGGVDRSAVEATRSAVRSAGGLFKSLRLVEREENWGLSRNIVDGVTRTVEEWGRAIVLEDDIETSPAFLTYMNRALELYADDPFVASIHAYVYPHRDELPDTFFIRGADCWGWAVWERSWRLYEGDAGVLLARLRSCPWAREFNFDGTYPYTRMLRDTRAGRVDSWAVRWYASAFLAGMYTLYPNRSLVRNSGNDGTGTHSGVSDRYEVPLAETCPPLERRKPETDPEGYDAFRKYFLSLRPSLAVRIVRRLASILRR